MTEQDVRSQLVRFDIPCVILDRAIAFYSAVLGCEVHREEGDGFSLGIFPHGGQAIGGCLAVMPNNPPSQTGVLIYLNCDGRLEEAVAEVEPNGGTIQQAIHTIGPHGRRAVVLDSEGNRVALHSN